MSHGGEMLAELDIYHTIVRESLVHMIKEWWVVPFFPKALRLASNVLHL